MACPLRMCHPPSADWRWCSELCSLSAYDRGGKHEFQPAPGRSPESRARAEGRAVARILEMEPLLERNHASFPEANCNAWPLAAHGPPTKAFLLDEPLSNLDAALQGKCGWSWCGCIGNSTHMIYVTHDQLEAMTMADRIVVLNNGESSNWDRHLTSTSILPLSSWQDSSAPQDEFPGWEVKTAGDQH